MSDTPTPEAPRASSPMTRRVGPFTVAQWLLIVGAGVGLGLVIRKVTAGFGGDAADLPADVGEASGAYTAGGGYAAGGSGYSTAGAVPINGSGQLPINAPTSNQEWLRRAVDVLAAMGTYAAADTATALGRWIDGEELTARQYQIVNAAISAIGLPPEYVPPAVVAAEPSPTTPVPTMPVPPAPAPPTSAPVTPAPEDPNVVKMRRSIELKAKANSGQPMTDSELHEMARMPFSSGDPTLSQQFRFYYRLWLDGHGYAGQNL